MLIPSGNPSEIPFYRGTAERHNVQLLSAHLRHSIVEGEITASDFADWLSKPWTAIRFLEGRVSPKEESWRTNPLPVPFLPSVSPTTPSLVPNVPYWLDLIPGDVLTTLREWANEADKSEQDRINWENGHLTEKRRATEVITQLHTALAPSVETLEKTGESLNAAKGLNAVERILRGTKEYVVDEFWDHPEMSAGLVILTYFAFKRLKGTRLGTLLLAAGGVSVAGAFIKNKFGVEPTEKLAEVAENLGLKPMADGIRATRDTINRGLFGPEGENTLNGYYYDKFDLHRKLTERIAFNFLLYQNPKEFLKWYDEARRWKLPTTGKKPTNKRVPAEVSGLVREMSRGKNIPSSFKELPIAERMQILLNATDHILLHVAEMNGGRTVDDGLARLQQKYIDGEYFKILWDRFDAFSADLKTKYTHPEIVKQIDRIRAAHKDFYTGMARRVRHGSDVIQFMDLLFVETPDAELDKLHKYAGAGITLGEMGEAFEIARKKIVALGGDAAKKGLDAWNAMADYVTKTVPGYWGPILTSWWNAGSKKAQDAYDYLFVDIVPGTTDTRFSKALKDARAAGQGVVRFIVTSRIAHLFAEIGMQAGQTIEITLQEAEHLAEWLEEQSRLSEILQTLEIRLDGVDLVFDLGRIAAPAGPGVPAVRAVPLPGNYRLFATATFYPEEDPLHPVPTPPPAGHTVPDPHTERPWAAPITIPAGGAPIFRDFPFLTDAADPAAFNPGVPHYRYSHLVVEMEIRTPVGTEPVAVRRMSRRLSL